jgi:hypothetical protein
MLAAITAVIVVAVFSFGGMVRQTFVHTESCITSQINAHC